MEHLQKLKCRQKIVFFVGKNCVTLGQTTPSHTPMRQKISKILFDIRIADNILGKVMKQIVCQTLRFCRIRINVRKGGRFDPSPLLGLTH